MLSDRVARMIERDAHQLADRWVEVVLQDEHLPSYQKLDPKDLHQRCFLVYSRLRQWLNHRTSKEKLVEHYTALGRERCREGIPLSELIHALLITRRLLYFYMSDAGLLYQDALVLSQCVELTNRVISFFDRAVFHVARGYEEEQKRLDRTAAPAAAGEEASGNPAAR